MTTLFDVTTTTNLGSVLTAALTISIRNAFVITCEVLRTLSQFHHYYQEESRDRTAAIQAELLEVLSTLPAGTRSIRRARWIVENADPGCENVAEAILLCYVVIGFTWSELFDPGAVLSKTHRAIAMAGRRIERTNSGLAA